MRKELRHYSSIALLTFPMHFGCRTGQIAGKSEISANQASTVIPEDYKCKSERTSKVYEMRHLRGEIDVKPPTGSVTHYTGLDVQVFASDSDASVTLTQFTKPQGDVIATLEKSRTGAVSLKFELDDDSAKKCDKITASDSNERFSCRDGSRRFTVRVPQSGRGLEGIFYDFGDLPASFTCKEPTTQAFVCEKVRDPRMIAKASISRDGRRLVDFELAGGDDLYSLTCE